MRGDRWLKRVLGVAWVVFWAGSGSVWGQGLEYVKSHYTKFEYRVPMRDGKRLFTAVYVPKDTSQQYPILFNRTPYSVAPYGVERFKADLGPSPLFGKQGYIVAYQDVRGRSMSEGEFVNVRPYLGAKKGPKEIDENSDTWDTIDWLLGHVPGNNGKVGQWGISYPGFYTAMGMIDAHPALKAASPQAPIMDWFIGDDWHHHGALMLPHAFNFMAMFGRPRPAPVKKPFSPFEHGTPDGYEFFLQMGPLANADVKYFKGEVAFWSEVMRHGAYDEFWKARNLRPHLQGIKPAVLTVGGWFDAENLFGALETYRSVRRQSPQTSNTLVMGPWTHGSWSHGEGRSLGAIPFDVKTGEFYRENIELPFFEYHLKGKGSSKDNSPNVPGRSSVGSAASGGSGFAGRPGDPGAWIFQTGVNTWRKFPAWPPKESQPKSLYFAERGRLGWDAAALVPGRDEYVSDPAKPVPFMDKTSVGMTGDYMLEDQRWAGRRPDVLVYQTAPLEEDLTLLGPIEADLHVATSGTDSDWIVKVIDVYPEDAPDPSPNPAGVRMGGYQLLVRGDVMRGKFRNSYERPEPMVAKEPTQVKFTMPDICHTFRPGHRLMVQVQSTWFPLVDRNPQRFCDIHTAKESDFQKATQHLYYGGSQKSRLVVQVLP